MKKGITGAVNIFWFIKKMGASGPPLAPLPPCEQILNKKNQPQNQPPPFPFVADTICEWPLNKTSLGLCLVYGLARGSARKM